MQRKLADSERARCAAEKEAADVRRQADATRGDLEQKVRTATEDGHLRVKLLEETVERLGQQERRGRGGRAARSGTCRSCSAQRRACALT